MSVFQAIVLGIVQGATEFIPVSSSGHLVLVPWLLGWEYPPLVFDTVVHLGTLLAVLGYFWRDWWELITAWLHGLRRMDWSDTRARLVWLLVLGTVPAAVLGYALEDLFESLFSEPALVSFFMLVTAALLATSEWRGRQTRSLSELGRVDALTIGLGQAAAIVPGISRSGATISVGLFRGLNRAGAARFSFLLGTPIILGAGLFQLLKLSDEPQSGVTPLILVAGFVSAAVTGYLSVSFMLRYLQRGKLYPFAFYCFWVGLSCLIVAWLR